MRGEANGEGQSHGYRRLTTSSAQVLSSMLTMIHLMLRYSTVVQHYMLLKKSPVPSSRSHMEKPWKRAQGPGPKTMNNLSTARSASSHACLRQCLTLCTPIGQFPHP